MTAWQQELLNRVPKYGNDEDYVDVLARKAALIFCDAVARHRNPRGGRFQPGLQSVSMHALFAGSVGATPDGRKMEMLPADGGVSPAQGRDRRGPSAVIRSVAKLDHRRARNGALLNLKLHPSALGGERGLGNLQSLITTFFGLRGQHVQFNVVSGEMLRDAQKHPERYPALVVRVAGFSVFFTDIDETLQNDIIARTQHASV